MPINALTSDMNIYIFLKKIYILAIFFVSFFAKGSYKLYTITVPIPNSANDISTNKFENNPLIPKYSIPNFLINNVVATIFKNKIET